MRYSSYLTRKIHFLIFFSVAVFALAEGPKIVRRNENRKQWDQNVEIIICIALIDIANDFEFELVSGYALPFHFAFIIHCRVSFFL